MSIQSEVYLTEIEKYFFSFLYDRLIFDTGTDTEHYVDDNFYSKPRVKIESLPSIAFIVS